MTRRADSPDLLRPALAGNREAWARLVDVHTALVFRVALRTGLGREDAEDVTQAVWMELLQHGSQIRDHQALPGWLAVVARRIALRKRREARSMLELPEDLPDGGPPVEQLLSEEQEIRRVRVALRSLPEQCRVLLAALFAPDRPSYRRLAARLGIPIGSIGPTRARCLARLARVLEEEGP